jgi:hypothetical protein
MTRYDDIRTAIDSAEAAHNQEVAALQKRIDELQAVPEAVPPPPSQPQQPPATGLPPLIGSSSLPGDWNTRKKMLEATGGRLEARRVFSALDKDPSTILNECKTQNTVPVLSFKVPYTWAQMGTGSGDAQMKAAANRIKQTWGDRLLYIVFHHEPGQIKLGPTQGEGGPATDFPKMWNRVLTVMKPLLPSAEFGPIMNGWMWTSRNAGFSDATFNTWLPKSLRDQLDFIAADDYNAAGDGEKAVDRIKRRVAWMQRIQFKGYTGVGETNAFVPEELTSVFDYAKTSEAFRNGFVLLWNSTGDAYKPVHETGLLDDFQKILVGWR